MSEKTKEAIALEDRSRPQMASASAGEVFAIWNQAKELLKDVPWVGIGAALTALGAAILYCYFQVAKTHYVFCAWPKKPFALVASLFH